MTITRKDLKTAGREAARHLAEAADAALIEAGEAAQRRQTRRAVKKTLKAVGKAALVVGTVAVARAAVRRARRRPTKIL